MPARWSSLRSLGAIGTAEAVAIGLTSIVSVAASVILLPDLRGVAGAGLALLMIAIAAVDARRFIIPNELTAAALLLGIVYAALVEPDARVTAIAVSVLRGAVLGLAFWAVRTLYRRLRGREGIGLGDVKLACVAGVWLDWPTIPAAIEIAALAALAVCGVKYLRNRQSIRAGMKLPFGLFLAPAIWLAWLLGTTLLTIPLL